VIALASGCLLAVTDLHARAEIRSADVSLTSAVHQLSGVRTELARAEKRLAGVWSARQALTRSFDTAQSTLSATAGDPVQGRGRYSMPKESTWESSTPALGAVEQALNQLAVGQTAGGLASLRASSSSCSALNEVG